MKKKEKKPHPNLTSHVWTVPLAARWTACIKKPLGITFKYLILEFVCLFVAAQTAANLAFKGKLQSVESRTDKALEAAGAAPGKKGKGS